MQTLCRDCGRWPPADAGTCPACGSARVFRHAELHDLAIAHLDCDAFYAAIEKRERPELRDVPVIVGGRHRGVVAACCYVARTYGVRSAMPMFQALKACPGAVVVRPDMKKYAAVGRQVRVMMLELTPLVEPLSIDEAFMDLSGTEALHRASPAESLARLARRVEDELSITVSIGLSYNKFLAKIASDLDKPRGFAAIGRAEARSFLAGKPVGLLWGVGEAMRKRLARDGITVIGQLARIDEAELVARYGKIGRRLHLCARGEDDRPVDPEREAKSMSSEITLDEDLSDPDALRPILWQLAETVGAAHEEGGDRRRRGHAQAQDRGTSASSPARAGSPPPRSRPRRCSARPSRFSPARPTGAPSASSASAHTTWSTPRGSSRAISSAAPLRTRTGSAMRWTWCARSSATAPSSGGAALARRSSGKGRRSSTEPVPPLSIPRCGGR